MRAQCRYFARRQMETPKPIAVFADRGLSCSGSGNRVLNALPLCTRFRKCFAGIISTRPAPRHTRTTAFWFQSGAETPPWPARQLRAIHRTSIFNAKALLPVSAGTSPPALQRSSASLAARPRKIELEPVINLPAGGVADENRARQGEDDNTVWPDLRRNPKGWGQFSRFPRCSSLTDTRAPTPETKTRLWGPRFASLLTS